MVVVGVGSGGGVLVESKKRTSLGLCWAVMGSVFSY